MARRLTESYKRLRANVARGQTLLHQFFDQPGGVPRARGRPRTHELELLRSVLVLAVGALDAYLSDLVVENFPSLAGSGDRDVFRRLEKARPGLALRLAFLDAKQRDAELVAALDAEFSGDSMHGSKAVMRVADWCDLGVGSSDFKSTEFPNTFADLDRWTETRHRIVHRGEKARMSRKDAGDIIDLIKHIGVVLNKAAIDRHG